MEQTEPMKQFIQGDNWLIEQQRTNEGHIFQKKILRTQRKKVAQLHYELQLIQQLQLQMMLTPTKIEQDEQYVVMHYAVSEHYIPLTQLLGKRLQPTAFLKLSIQLTNCFIELHQVSHIYQNFHPHHVFIHQLNNNVKFINFEHTFKASHQQVNIERKQVLPSKRLLYMAPEETGRVNSEIDFSTDLYALGALFYELLTGQPVYEGEGEELLHEMLTKQPKSFAAFGVEVPSILEKIIFKLLSKNKADRYQSAIGLKEDLTICWHRLTNQIALADFELGCHDEPGRWQLTSMNPSSEQRLKQLLNNLYAGEPVQLVTGEENSGKSFMLRELKHQYSSSYSASILVTPKTQGDLLDIPDIFLALRKNIQFIVQNNQLEELKNFKRHIAFMPQMILNFLPELRHLESDLRFNEVQQYMEQQQLFQLLQQLIDYFNVTNMPMLYVVDDYERLDSFTQQFLQSMLQLKGRNRFVFSFVKENNIQLLFSEHTIPVVKMARLSKDAIYAWLCKSLKVEGQVIRQCSNLLFDVTDGIPLYIASIFNDICELQIMKYDIQAQKWQFDISKIPDLQLEHYDAFMDKTLTTLSNDERVVVSYAICFGGQFNIAQLFQVVPYSYEYMLQLILQLVEKRIIVLSHEQLSMLELLVDLEKVQEFDMYAQFFNKAMLQKAKQVVIAEEMKKAHLKIIEYLCMQQTTTLEHKRRLLYHLDAIKDELSGEKLHLYLMLNQEIGTLTIKNALFKEALQLSQAFEEKMPEHYWTSHYDLALNGKVLHANALYLNNELDAAKPLFESILQKVKTTEDKLFVYNETVLFLTFSQVDDPEEQKLQHILHLAEESLRLVGIKMPRRALTGHLLKEYALLKLTIYRKTETELLTMPGMLNRRIYLVLQIMMNVCGVALIVDEKIFTWIVMRGLRLLHAHGDAVFASFYYGGFSNILAAAFHDFDNAYRFGQLSIRHLEKHDNILYKGNIYINYGGITSFLKEPPHKSMYYLYKTQQYSIPNSLHDLYNAMAASYILIYKFLQGSSINDIKLEYDEQRQYYEATNNPISKTYAEELMHWMYVLQNESTSVEWNYTVLIQTRVSLYESHLILRLIMSYFMKEHAQALKILHALDEMKNNSNIRPERPYYYFYKALVLHEELKLTIDKRKHNKLKRAIKKCMLDLKKFVQSGPDNYKPLYTLLEAMQYQQQSNAEMAMLYFDRSIQMASVANNPMLEAIGQLNAALFYEKQYDILKASEYMQRALELLYRWGAPYIVNVLSIKYHHLLQREQIMQQQEQQAAFQVAPIIKLYQKIAQLHDAKQLAKVALKEMMLQIDANDIYFIKVVNDSYYPVAQLTDEGETFTYYDKKQQPLPNGIEAAMIKRVVNTKSYVVRDNAQAKEKSVIALAVFNQGRVTAIIYAKNYMMASIFTKSKIDIISILATQFLIALENLERQQQLELEVAHRTEELSNLNAQLQEMNAQLLQGEQERKYFLQHISHDLRSPLTSVLGYVEALESGIVKSEEKKQQYLARSKIRLQSLQHLIKDLFDLTQLEGGNLPVHFETVQVEQLFSVLEDKLYSDLQMHHIRFKSSAQKLDGTKYVKADVERLLQVLDNITSNIIKYANEGTVSAHFSVNEHELVISISDQGIGIPQKDLPFIFDMHYVASNHSMKESYGIGMVICKKIVELHDGHISVASIEGQGTTFNIQLPLTQA